MPAGTQQAGPAATGDRPATWPAMLTRLATGPDAAWTVLLLSMLAFGVWLRVQQLTVPASLTFDEPFFVTNARHYLAHAADTNDHPPLGKLLIAGAMVFAGDSPLGWRIVPLLFGLANMGLAFAIARRAFGERRAGLVAAAFLAMDGFLVSYSRTALLDGMLTGFVLAALLLMLPQMNVRRLAGAALCVGLAGSVKLSGFSMLLPLALAYFLSWRRLPCWSAALLLLLPPLAFHAQYSLGLALSRAPAGPHAVLASMTDALRLHMSHTGMGHPASSPWYTWFLPLRPLPLRKDITPLGMETIMTTLGHPLLWWSSPLTVAGVTLSSAVRLVWHRLLRGKPDGRTQKPATHSAIPVLLTAWVAMLLPWIVTRRDSFIYHYLPTYTVGLVLLASVVERLRKVRPTTAMVTVAVVAIVGAFYAPVWGQIPLREDAASWRLFLEVWR